jgi:hypothetical protein
MGQQLSPKDMALYRAVDEVLHYVWDPIGVSNIPQARHEYHGYLPQVFNMLREGSSASTVAFYLTKVTTERMGLSENAEHDLEVARVLIEWKEYVLKRQS